MSQKKIVIFVILGMLLLAIGFAGGYYTKIRVDHMSVIREKEKKSSLAKLMSEDEIEKLKETIKKDEADYGNNYQNLEGSGIYTYKREPDRIYFKSSKVGAFYVFEKNDKDYGHFLEVIEDRMHYSIVSDFNLYCFTPVSIDKMITSGENYIVFDYDNDNLSEGDEQYNKDIIFRFNENTRLYRLATYLSYYKEPIKKSDLPKKEFAGDTNVSGYRYMMHVDEYDV